MASILSRKRDLVYLAFFMIHVPIVYLADVTSLYPEAIRPAFVNRIREFYVNTYHDKFFEGHAPAWFTFFLLMEALYHGPVSIWAVGALLRDDPLVPLNLLVWAVQTVITTVACLAEVWSWTDRTQEQKSNLTMLYAPYALLAALMGLDMFARLRGQLLQKTKRE
ncbi:putative integral membrane protein [Thermoascus aurantiacus ATCC 26904]